MRAKRFRLDCFFVRGYESGHRNGRQQFNLRGGPRNRDMAYMADLAMLFVRLMTVPVPCRLDGKNAHGKNQGNRQ